MLEKELSQASSWERTPRKLTNEQATAKRFHPGRCYSGNMLRRCWALVCTQAIGFQGLSHTSFFEPSLSKGEGGHLRCCEFTAFDNFGITFGGLPPMLHTHGVAVWHMLTSPRKAIAKTFATPSSSSATSIRRTLGGVPSLTGSDLLKVQMANSLYKAAVVILEICRRIGCCITIENPLRSWLWMLLAHYVRLTGNQALVEWYAGLECVMFDACAHGSDRDKRTKLLATPTVFSDLEQYCSGDHQHASWTPYQHNGRLCFPTASEAEYPTILCDRMAACVLKFASSRNIVVSQTPKLKDLMKLQLGQQSIKHPPLIPEFKDFVFLEKSSDEPHLKLLAAPYNRGQQQLEQPHSLEETTTETTARPSGRQMYKYGVWHSPAEFLEKAQHVTHPS